MQQDRIKAMMTTEEREMLRDNIILLMMLNMIDLNRKQLEGSFNTLKPLFLMATDRLVDLINADIIAIKKHFRFAK